MAWNSNYGNVINRDLQSAWDSASMAVQRYSSFLEAVMQTQAQLNAISNNSGSSFGSASSGVNNQDTSPNIIGNSGNHNTTPSQTATEAAVRAEANRIVSQMQANGNRWAATDDPSLRASLANANLQLGAQLQSTLNRAGVPVTVWREEASGIWWISQNGNRMRLYDHRFHDGGIVGGNPTIKDNEVLALLENGEAVLTEQQKDNMTEAVKTVNELSSRLSNLTPLTPDNPSYNLIEKFNAAGGINLFNGLGMNRIREQFADQAKALLNPQNINNYNSAPVTIEKIEAPIMVTEKLTRDDIIEHHKTIADIASRAQVEGFSRAGITSLRGSTLRPY